MRGNKWQLSTIERSKWPLKICQIMRNNCIAKLRETTVSAKGFPMQAIACSMKSRERKLLDFAKMELGQKSGLIF